MVKLNLEKIKQLRKKNKLSQEEMAKIIGANSKWPYHRKELGNQDFTAEDLSALSNYFDVRIEYFFDNEVAKNAKTKKSQKIS